MPYVSVFEKITASLQQHQTRPAFYIRDTFYSYGDLGAAISSIRQLIASQVSSSQKNIGLVANDDLLTYAGILALWMEGKAYVPVNPATPAERNRFIIQQSGIATLLDSSGSFFSTGITVMNTSALPATTVNLEPVECGVNELAYILFTSGTTGKPKGVPITRNNINAFTLGFDQLIPDITEEDRWLQMFDLTFDLSVMSYLIPLLKGACVYTIPPGRIKFSYICQLMEEQRLTGALLVPSIIHYLRPYFEDIRSMDMKYCLFCGEALSADLVSEWSRCLPEATILNVYGPTENTIFCTGYRFDTAIIKSYQGILSIGRSMAGSLAIIVDQNNRQVTPGEKGELCLGGAQLSPGYWQDEEKNRTSFFDAEFNGQAERFYKTGDLCLQDADADIMYIGRMDSQVKIQGFRVELLEVEYYARQFLKDINVIAATFINTIGNTEIGLVIESYPFDSAVAIGHIKDALPSYMVPTRIIFRPVFPYNINGKIDREALKKSLQA